MRTAVEIAAWWCGLAGLWLLTLSTPSAPELGAGAVAALVAAAAAFGARRALTGRWRFRLGWLRWFTSLPVSAVRESAVALTTVARNPEAGRLEHVELLDESRAVHDGRLAAAAFVVGCTPGTMVVAGAPGTGRLVVHRLPGSGGKILRQVRR
ncbi:Na+/H+ antiporter subunit E [Amycolatopsis jiangsuensis]|uniref:Multisubunit Na+/H+ antiporter MnhE subunit n=1 Tax=Amycolatopsis jiangsuensis TaxID=1181879 RepID=A0A840ISQ2_9PSEU|nr:Na+/H+ antiporter subunit E [Amycolatopsis jiangsuensis]MBB4684024.1 multisubunit Na+/H+ antiporter MnhE subunit [Amycolatopsis jiangsuensis]